MVKYTLQNLQKKADEDGARLIRYPTVLERDKCPITFKCHCGKEHTKGFHRILTHAGLFCTGCSLKNSKKKAKVTTESKLTEEDRYTIELKKKDETETLEKYNSQNVERNNIVARTEHDDHLDENIWLTHPTFSNYESNSKGLIRNKTRKSVIEGSISKGGYRTLTIGNKKNQFHRFTLESRYNIIIPRHFDVDHKDANSLNNSWENLQILTRLEHGKKTAIQNPIRIVSKNICKRVKRTKGDEIHIYESIVEACKKVNVCKRRIHDSIKKNKPDSGGYLWSTIDDTSTEIKDEIWKDCVDLPNLLVSNQGRIQKTNYHNNSKTFGDTENHDGYKTVSQNGRNHLIHRLICITFNGNCTDESYTVDHIDGNKTNNASINLRWASKKEQARNRRGVVPVETYNTKTLETIKIYETKDECSEDFKRRGSQISDIVNMTLRNGNLRKYLSKDISVRIANLTAQEKFERELKILDHEIEVLSRDANKRKEDSIDLPHHITKSGGKFRFTIKFRDVKHEKHLIKLDDIVSYRDNYILKRYNEEIANIKYLLGITTDQEFIHCK
jgi:hypothetical protein